MALLTHLVNPVFIEHDGSQSRHTNTPLQRALNHLNPVFTYILPAMCRSPKWFRPSKFLIKISCYNFWGFHGGVGSSQRPLTYKKGTH